MANTIPQDPNLVAAFFAELINRFFAPTPKVMQIISNVLYILSGITLIPLLFPALVGTAGWVTTTFIVSIISGTLTRLAVRNTAAVASKLPFTVATDGVPMTTTLTKVI